MLTHIDENNMPRMVDVGAKDESELETALSAVYGYLTLTLKGKEISEETRQSMKQISSFLALLAHRYQMEQTGSDLEPQP